MLSVERWSAIGGDLLVVGCRTTAEGRRRHRDPHSGRQAVEAPPPWAGRARAGSTDAISLCLHRRPQSRPRALRDRIVPSVRIATGSPLLAIALSCWRSFSSGVVIPP